MTVNTNLRNYSIYKTKARTQEIFIVCNFIGTFDFTHAIENSLNTCKKAKNSMSIKLLFLASMFFQVTTPS